MSDVLTFDKVRVQCPYPIQFITGLELTSCVNEHSRVSVTGVLYENEQDGCIGAARVADPIDILEIGEHGEAPLFSGVVTSLKVRHESGLYHVEIEGQSRTYQMDLKKKSRSFQDGGTSYSEVIEAVISGYPGSYYGQIPPDRQTGTVILQYDETDWEFLRRLASHFNTVLVAEASGKGPRFWFGVPQNESEIEETTEYTARNYALRHRHLQSRGVFAVEGDFIKIVRPVASGQRNRGAQFKRADPPED